MSTNTLPVTVPGAKNPNAARLLSVPPRTVIGLQRTAPLVVVPWSRIVGLPVFGSGTLTPSYGPAAWPDAPLLLAHPCRAPLVPKFAWAISTMYVPGTSDWNRYDPSAPVVVRAT